MKKLLDKIPPRIRRLIVDTTLLTLSFLCFTTFIYNSIYGFSFLAGGTSIAKVTHGSPDRKRMGMLTFNEISTGTDLFHRDTIWVGPSKNAEIRFDNGTLLKIAENTLLVLFRQMGMADQVDVITGNVTVDDSRSKDKDMLKVHKGRNTPEPDESPIVEDPNTPAPVTRAPSPAAPLDEGIRYLRPKPNAIYYLATKKSSAEITFAWPKAVKGFLVVMDLKNKEIARAPTSEKVFVRIDLKAGQALQWKLVDAAQKPIVGPYRFEIMPFDKEALQNALLNGAPDRPIEVIN